VSDEQDARRCDFFVSYTGADTAWAEWIAWQLTEAGYAVTIQAWHFRPGMNFLVLMRQALDTLPADSRGRLQGLPGSVDLR
jgi:hypothetical protein